MDNKQVTAEWIAKQRAVCDSGILDSLMKLEQEAYGYNIGGMVCGMEVAEFERLILSAAACAEVLTHSIDALEASMQREAEKDATIARLTAERDAETKRADAVPEIDIRPLQPGYMGVCTNDDEDGIQIRKVSHKHPQGRGYLDDDEDVQDVVVIRFADTAQVLAVVDRLLVLADAMAEKTRRYAENTDAPTGAESEDSNG